MNDMNCQVEMLVAYRSYIMIQKPIPKRLPCERKEIQANVIDYPPNCAINITLYFLPSQK